MAATDAPTAPVAKPCGVSDANRACLADTHDLAPAFAKAMDGDYQSQRNIAWAFSGASPFVEADPVQACAWRQVISATRPADAAYTDDDQKRVDCGKLTASQIEAADRVSAQIIAGMKTR